MALTFVCLYSFPVCKISKLQVSDYNLYAQKQKIVLLHKKAESHVINSHALTGEKPCINKAIHDC